MSSLLNDPKVHDHEEEGLLVVTTLPQSHITSPDTWKNPWCHGIFHYSQFLDFGDDFDGESNEAILAITSQSPQDGYDVHQSLEIAPPPCCEPYEWQDQEHLVEGSIWSDTFSFLDLSQEPEAFSAVSELNFDELFPAGNVQSPAYFHDELVAGSRGASVLGSSVPGDVDSATDSRHLVDRGSPYTRSTQESASATMPPASPPSYPGNRIDNPIVLDTDEDSQPEAPPKVARSRRRKRKTTKSIQENSPKQAKRIKHDRNKIKPRDCTNIRLEQVTINVGGCPNRLRWDRRREVWTDVPFTSEWKCEELQSHVLGDLACSVLRVRPNAEFLPIDVSWDDAAESFVGSDLEDEERLRFGKDELETLFNDPNVGMLL